MIETTKPRITRLVTVTSAVGFALAALSQRWELGQLLLAGAGAVAGTSLSAAGANSLNQWLERERDARMPRTMGRPLPEGRLKPGAVAGLGVALGLAGVAVLWAAC